VIGKVLNDQGVGLESWVIAGMQWAATRARIVSMSFATGPSPGYDLQSRALNQLSTSHHVTSVDGGKTWQLALVKTLGGGRFAGTMPEVAAGVGVSLRVTASDAGGSKVAETIIKAYHR